MRSRLVVLALGGAAALMLAPATPANAVDCDRLIHGDIIVGHVCLGPRT